MTNENLYFLKVDLLSSDIEYLRQITRRVKDIANVGEFNDDFHLTVENSLYCPRKSIRNNLDTWLEMNSQFKFTLDSVDSFLSRTAGIIYLTSSSSEETDRMSDFHYGIHELIKSTNPNKQNNYRYIPHITLLREVPTERVSQLIDIFLQELVPFTINISEVTIRETKANGQETTTRHQLGGN
ncbi:hypothetical protein SDC9_83799 [bioreactor metagenome]|uniref:RNA 2',3'-cyclic phosphodiesterase n=1 Tax=bioreactor metagenome TaxID=1076179 RepID=A0A644Z8P8_9ZZZZ